MNPNNQPNDQDGWDEQSGHALAAVSLSDVHHEVAKRIAQHHAGEAAYLLANPNVNALEDEPEQCRAEAPCPDVSAMRRQPKRYASLLRHVFLRRVYHNSHDGTTGSAPHEGFVGNVARRGRIRAALQNSVRGLRMRAGRTRVYVLMLLTGCGGGGNGALLPMLSTAQEVQENLKGVAEVHTVGIVTRATIVDEELEARRHREAALFLSLSAAAMSPEGIDVGGSRPLTPSVIDELYVVDAPPGHGELSVVDQTQYVEELGIALIRPQLRNALDGRQKQWDTGDAAGIDGLPCLVSPAGVAVVLWDAKAFTTFAAEYILPAAFDSMKEVA
jgi:hypothetical protein